jgi:hypothetical protein
MSDTARRRRSDELLDLPPATEFPTFASEAEEAEFWSTHSSHLLWDQMEDVTHTPPPNLRRRPPGEESTARKRPPEGRMDLVSIRLPAEMIDGVKAVAARRHLPYQTLMRSWIGERLEQERAIASAEQDAPGLGT